MLCFVRARRPEYRGLIYLWLRRVGALPHKLFNAVFTPRARAFFGTNEPLAVDDRLALTLGRLGDRAHRSRGLCSCLGFQCLVSACRRIRGGLGRCNLGPGLDLGLGGLLGRVSAFSTAVDFLVAFILSAFTLLMRLRSIASLSTSAAASNHDAVGLAMLEARGDDAAAPRARDLRGVETHVPGLLHLERLRSEVVNDFDTLLGRTDGSAGTSPVPAAILAACAAP